MFFFPPKILIFHTLGTLLETGSEKALLAADFHRVAPTTRSKLPWESFCTDTVPLSLVLMKRHPILCKQFAGLYS